MPWSKYSKRSFQNLFSIKGKGCGPTIGRNVFFLKNARRSLKAWGSLARNNGACLREEWGCRVLWLFRATQHTVHFMRRAFSVAHGKDDGRAPSYDVASGIDGGD